MIVFHRTTAQRSGIYTINADGSGLEPQFVSRNATSGSPVWLPDGRIAVFMRFPNRRDLDGLHTVPVTYPPTPLFRADYRGDPAPCGSKVVFATHDGGLFEANTDGSGLRRLTPSWLLASHPACSRDGTNIAFYSQATENSDIYAMDAGGGGTKNLTKHAAADTYPAWSPGGSSIAFQSDRTGNDEIYVVSATGGAVKQLTGNPAWDGMPVWSPDGTSIAFVSQRFMTPDILIMNADGSGVTQLTSGGTADTVPDWR